MDAIERMDRTKKIKGALYLYLVFTYVNLLIHVANYKQGFLSEYGDYELYLEKVLICIFVIRVLRKNWLEGFRGILPIMKIMGHLGVVAASHRKNPCLVDYRQKLFAEFALAGCFHQAPEILWRASRIELVFRIVMVDSVGEENPLGINQELFILRTFSVNNNFFFVRR